MPQTKGSPVAVTFLGGLGEIGRNCAVLETNGRRVLLDCGRMFAGNDLPGVDSVLPSFDWLLERGEPNSGVEACVVTHAHEDHIGALPYLLEHLKFPIYGSPFTLALVRHKLTEAGLIDRASLHPVNDGDRFTAGPFECEALPVTHSIPGGLITAFDTPQGIILHSSDFKLDHTPVDGRRTGLARIGAIAHNPGVRLLLADSTNAGTPGSTDSESEIGPVLQQVLAEQQGRRVIIGSFASHVHRIQQIADAAAATGRVVATLGLSMNRNVTLARQMGLLRIADESLRDIKDMEGLEPGRQLIVCTGSQGEPQAAISQMAAGTSKWVEIGPSDTVIFSSHPIPGNNAALASVRNGLSRRGARVIHGGHLRIHTSGHGHRGELRVLHSVASPEWFVPVHGEHEHLVAHAELATGMGMPPDRVLLCTDGDRIELHDQGVVRCEPVGDEPILVDGTVGDLGPKVLGERRKLGSHGFVSITVCVNIETGEIVAGPRVITRGWVEEPAEDTHEAAVAFAVRCALTAALKSGCTDIEDLTRSVRRSAKAAAHERTRRYPMIVPQVIRV